MLLVARKNLLSERTRLSIAVGGVALSVFLISLLLSLYRGWDERVGGFVESVEADIWVAREGTTDFINASSILPVYGKERLEAVPAVAEAHPLIVRPMSVRGENDKKLDVHLVGFDPVSRAGGPQGIKAGKAVPGPDEVIIDKAMSSRYGVEIGDTLSTAIKTLRVVGTSSGGDYVAAYLAFVTLDTASEMLQQEGFVTFFLVKLRDPNQAGPVARELERLEPGIQASTGKEFADATRDRVLGLIIPILAVILLLAFIVGLAVAGLTIYTATVEKAREYGILKAVGFSNPYLYRLVVEQSVVTALLGFGVGAGLTTVVAPFAHGVVPQFVVLVRWQDVLGVAGVTLIMAVLAAYVPVRRLAAIDPVSVFRA